MGISPPLRLYPAATIPATVRALDPSHHHRYNLPPTLYTSPILKRYTRVHPYAHTCHLGLLLPTAIWEELCACRKRRGSVSSQRRGGELFAHGGPYTPRTRRTRTAANA